MAKSVHTHTYKKFREILRLKRQEKGMSQTALAKKLGEPQQYVSRYETGERRLDVVQYFEVASKLGFDPVESLRGLYEFHDKRRTKQKRL